MQRIDTLHQPIEEITLSLYNVEAVRKFSFGTWTSRQHVFLSLSAGGEKGWGENILAVNQPDLPLETWGNLLQTLKNLTPGQALRQVRSQRELWPDRVTEIAEMALFDLAGKLLNVPAVELLGLTGREPVHGVYVILSDDLDFVEAQTQHALASSTAQYIKVKLFGDLALDCAVIQSVRKHAPRPQTYLIGDVNGGYRMHEESTPLEDIAQSMNALYTAGLDACEDPAYCSNEEWVALQTACQPLSLIPDYPMRPATRAMESLLPGMGNLYNIHPGCTGSIIDAVALAHHVGETLDAKVMIGDDSLIGPGCTIWQQIAIGLQAVWVEAVEKEGDSDFYKASVEALATDSRNNPIQQRNLSPGFGIQLGENKLYASAKETLTL